MENTIEDPTQVRGWGVDADAENDPTYPMRRRNSAEHAGYTWKRPTQQRTDVEVLHSNERPSLTTVFGTTSPPAGLSGMLRRFAFRYSESSYAHWLPLVLADRVGVVEGIVGDLAHGHVPNIPGELGWKAEWKHNRKGFVTQLLGATVLALGLLAYLRRADD